MKKLTIIVICFILSLLNEKLCLAGTINKVEINSCNSNQYYDATNLICRDCNQQNMQQRSADGLTCECKVLHRYLKNNGGSQVECEACPNNQVATKQGWDCVACPAGQNVDRNTGRCVPCQQAIQARVYRLINGQLDGNQVCQNCVGKTEPNKLKDKCQVCTNKLNLYGPTKTDCVCDSNNDAAFTGLNVCFPLSVKDSVPADTAEIKNIFPAGESNTGAVKSAFFEQYLRTAIIWCDNEFKNATACQLVANACVMLIYNMKNVAARAGDACGLFEKLRNQRTGTQIPNFPDWVPNMPWLYYTNDNDNLQSKSIKKAYQREDYLQMQFMLYNLNGSFIGTKNHLSGALQLCRPPSKVIQETYRFGTFYKQTCEISVDDLFDSSKYPLQFIDPYIEFKENNVAKLFPIPIRILQLRDQSAVEVNKKTDSSSWKLVRRLFLVDNEGAKTTITTQGTTGTNNAEFINVAQRITLMVPAQAQAEQSSTNGLIFSPYFTVNYVNVKRSELGQSKTLNIQFEVNYQAELSGFNESLTIVLIVFPIVAIFFAVLKICFWAKRNGNPSFDCMHVVKFVAYWFSAVANLGLAIIFLLTFYFLAFYKNQSVFTVFLPNSEQDQFFVIIVAVSFVLKLIEVIHLIVVQCTVDIFFIDWERPRQSEPKKIFDAMSGEQNALSAGKSGDIDGTGGGGAGAGHNNQLGGGSGEAGAGGMDMVSIWRTYICANEFNELQTTRKTNTVFTLLLVLFFASVLGFEHIASLDIKSERTSPAEARDKLEYRPDASRLFRFAIATAIFIAAGFVQWLYRILIHERFIDDPLRKYVDLCSVSNVSVFILAKRQFGYYIHGKSVHDRADLSLAQMFAAMEREKGGVCGRRGLEQNSDRFAEQQTYLMALPRTFHVQYDRLIAPLHSIAGRSGPEYQQARVDRYNILNRFLSQFIYRADASADMHYEFENRRCCDDLLNIESDDYSIIGRFYRDNGNGFGQILFYGNELTLFTLEILIFAVCDLAMQSTVLNAIITWLVIKLLTIFRAQLGTKNIAKKSLVDERFLI